MIEKYLLIGDMQNIIFDNEGRKLLILLFST